MKERPTAELLTLGTELVTGSVLNTNAAFLGCELTQLGFAVTHQTACPDDAALMQDAFRLALLRSDVIVISGGLGPTPDDITREVIAEFLGVPLLFSEEQYRLIRHFYRKRRKPVPQIVKKEAAFPKGAKPLLNQFGIALGFVVETGGRLMIVIPGVPQEVRRLFDARITPFLRKKFPRLEPRAKLIVKTIGLSEPEVMQRLGGSFFKIGEFQFGIYPELGEVTLRITSDSQAVISQLKQRVQHALKGAIYYFREGTLEEAVSQLLVRQHKSLALAESCTGGLISEMLTRIPGASRYFRGSVVAYHNLAKARLLNVSRRTLLDSGSVSAQSAREMAEGARTQFRTTLGLSITGIAGPAGGTAEKPVGLVHIAISEGEKRKDWKERFAGDRAAIQARASKKALEHLWRWLVNKKSAHF